ncbi:hypothetical protein AMECASPLE_004384 [Ameca splendens]|uniref:Uncharacterized protein n=1 Tax=Ameca splendens TaxID=208324 RepID=A0ABV0XBV4_9TELE
MQLTQTHTSCTAIFTLNNTFPFYHYAVTHRRAPSVQCICRQKTHKSRIHPSSTLHGLNMHVVHLNHHHFPDRRLRRPGGSLQHADHSHDRLHAGSTWSLRPLQQTVLQETKQCTVHLQI